MKKALKNVVFDRITVGTLTVLKVFFEFDDGTKELVDSIQFPTKEAADLYSTNLASCLREKLKEHQ